MQSATSTKRRARTSPSATVRGTIVEITATGHISVDIRTPATRRVLCDVLQTTHGPSVKLRPGDAVLVLLPGQPGEKGCVLGRTGTYDPTDTETVTIEADRELTLRCGDGAITLRHDGKVLTRAVDIASVAKRRHRIKGGSVDIN